MDKLQWDLETLLNKQTIDQLYDQWYKAEIKHAGMINSFYKSKENFKKFLALDLQTRILANRLSNYVSNHSSLDLSDPKWIGYQQKITNACNEIALLTSSYLNIVIANEKKIRSYLKDPKLKGWTRHFELLFKDKKHVLDKKSELLLAKIAPATYGIDDVYTTLTDSDLKYTDALDKNNKPHKISTPADVIKLLKDPSDRILRKNAWISFNKAFNDVKNTLTKTLYYNYLKVNKLSQLRKYKDYIDAALDNDEVNDKILLATYKNVGKFKNAFIEYKKHRSKLIKQIHKIDKLEPWDANLDLTKHTVKVNVEQAKKEVLNALLPLGNEYAKVVNKAFNENWISWLPQAHKMTGAYSIGGVYGLNKFYILMNFDNTSDSVSTIAHEIGHSVNSYYLTQAQDIYAEVDMFVAEMASIVNEMLLNFYWLKKYKNDKKMTLHVLENMLSTFFATTSRQITFSKFEYEANKLINNNQPFTVADVERLYLEARKQYEGVTPKALANMKKYPYNLANAMVLRVHHFYANNFYVYKYAIGQVVALVIANKIYHGDKKMLNNYLKFLSVGQSIPPLDIIKMVGIDLTKDDVYKEATIILNKLIKQFKQIKK